MNDQGKQLTDAQARGLREIEDGRGLWLTRLHTWVPNELAEPFDGALTLLALDPADQHGHRRARVSDAGHAALSACEEGWHG